MFEPNMITDITKMLINILLLLWGGNTIKKTITNTILEKLFIFTCDFNSLRKKTIIIIKNNNNNRSNNNSNNNNNILIVILHGRVGSHYNYNTKCWLDHCNNILKKV